jgi:Ca2+:H+ antiporter
LWVTPWGGAKYARVVWELGTYLFWPFGKYVEGWTDGGVADDDEDGAEGGYGSLDDDDDDGNEEEETTSHAPDGSYRQDPEAGGRTFGRGRSGTISNSASVSTSQGGTTRIRPSVDGVFRSDEQALPDEPLRASHRTIRATPSAGSLGRGASAEPADERSGLLAGRRAHRGYGSGSTSTTTGGVPPGANDKSYRSSGSEETITGGGIRPHDFTKDASSPHHPFRLRALGRVTYWVAFYGLIAPVMLLVCLLCWFFVFTIPMAKLLWVLLRHLNNEPLSLHFRAPREYVHIDQDLSSFVDEEGRGPPEQQPSSPSQPRHDSIQTLVGQDGVVHKVGEQGEGSPSGIVFPLRAGQPAPPLSRKSLVADKRKGRLRGPHPTVLLCTYRAAGLEYYKYTLDGVNIWFVNLLSLVFFAILDFFVLEPYVEHHPDASVFLKVVSGQAFIFCLRCVFLSHPSPLLPPVETNERRFYSLLAVIPLSYFIGMAVASISAQSSIGMGAVINASFGSVIEIILYSIALTQSKGELVEGSIVGSILAGVLLMPGASMIAGAVRRKEQRFNAKSAGVTSTMLIMAVIGTLTPTMFYEIYGSVRFFFPSFFATLRRPFLAVSQFQLTCSGCDITGGTIGGAETCRTCYYEHVSPVDDPFYKSTVKLLSYYCAIILVLVRVSSLFSSLSLVADPPLCINSLTSSDSGSRSALTPRRSGRTPLRPPTSTASLVRSPALQGCNPPSFTSAALSTSASSHLSSSSLVVNLRRSVADERAKPLSKRHCFLPPLLIRHPVTAPTSTTRCNPFNSLTA